MAIALQVVTRGDGQASLSCCLTQTQAFNQQLRQGGCVAFFCHGECDPARAFGGNGVQDILTLGGDHTGLPERTRHLPFKATGACNAHSIQTILRTQFVDQARLGHAHAMNAPAHIAIAQQLIKHHGLVRAVKRT